MKSILDRVLQTPTYGFERDGVFYKPTRQEIWREFIRKTNPFVDQKNWLAFWSWATTLSFAVPLIIFLVKFFSFKLLLLGFVYSMVILGSFGTFWFHRYGTHGAFKFTSKFARFLCRNLVIKIIPDEVYIISHHVHHRRSEQAGDPYNVHGGWLYCFLADVNHQAINRDLSLKDYQQVQRLMAPTVVRMNSYSEYLRWGSVCHPLCTVLHYALNWGFWYGVFYLIGGHALACCLFGSAGVWAIGVRTYNFEGHGGGRNLQKDGKDFHREDLSVNQLWPGYVAGEWHNNHHMYPSGARSGFLPYQLDLPWLWIRLLRSLKIVSHVRDYKNDFLTEIHTKNSA